ncbi:MAG: heme-binding Shp domain-containing protein [Oscillospiraceae bacterium]|jgi:hypothetical protein
MMIAKRLFHTFCSFAVVLAFMASITSETTLAAENGIYTAKASAHYIHPVTGEIEDSGNNPTIGQAMTDSVLFKTALIEVDSGGKTFVIVRFFLIDNIDDISFQVQKDGYSPFQSVDSTIMKEDLGDSNADFRMEIPSENAILRSTFYVVPMGRYVAFYMTFSGLEKGSGDFVTSITVSTAAVTASAETVTSPPEEGASVTDQTTAFAEAWQSEETTAPGEATSEPSVTTSEEVVTAAPAESTATITSSTVPEYSEADGLMIFEVNSPDEKEPPLNLKAFFTAGCLILVAVAGIILFYRIKGKRK